MVFRWLSPRGKRQRPHRVANVRPWLEILEDRLAPAVLFGAVNHRDLVFDNARGLLYITTDTNAATGTGQVLRYNPATNSWSNAPNMPVGRAYHHDNQITLHDGRVLLSGDVLVPDLLGAANATSIANADLYDPATNSWTATTMSRQRTGHAAAKLPDGRDAL